MPTLRECRRPHRRQHRRDGAEPDEQPARDGDRAIRPHLADDRSQRRPRRRPAVLRLLPQRLPAGLQAVDAEDLPAGCRRRGRAIRRRVRRPTCRRPRRSCSGRHRAHGGRGRRIGELMVTSPTVVVAGGGIESPALLLRSRIGGADRGAIPARPSHLFRWRDLRRAGARMGGAGAVGCLARPHPRDRWPGLSHRMHDS